MTNKDLPFLTPSFVHDPKVAIWIYKKAYVLPHLLVKSNDRYNDHSFARFKVFRKLGAI